VAATLALLLLASCSHLLQSPAAASYVEQSFSHYVAGFENVDRIGIRWEDCGIGTTAVSKRVLSTAATTGDPALPRPYRARIVDVRVLHTASGTPSSPPLTLPLGTNMTIIVTSESEISTEVGSYFEEVSVSSCMRPLGPSREHGVNSLALLVRRRHSGSPFLTTVCDAGGIPISPIAGLTTLTRGTRAPFYQQETFGFPFSHTSTVCDAGGITLPMGMGGTWGAGLRCPIPPGSHESSVTVRDIYMYVNTHTYIYIYIYIYIYMYIYIYI